MSRLRTALVLGTVTGIAVMVTRHLRTTSGHAVPGGILIDNVRAYDSVSRLLFGSFFQPIAADVAAVAGPGSHVLEVGCGPGHLSIRLAAEHGLGVVGLDLDPAMVERARANAGRTATGDEPTFVVGDVAALPFEDAAFDVVVSTLSMHHWDDPGAGLAEIARVLKPGGRALIWDLGPRAPLHRHAPDPVDQLRGSPLRLASARPWRWPWRLAFTQRIELANDPALPG